MNNFLKHNLEMPLTGGISGGGATTVADNEAVGDMKATARNDVSTENYLEIERFVDVTYDKVNEPDLYPFFKEFQPNALYYNENDRFWSENNNSNYFGVNVSDTYGIYFFNGKWIRVLLENPHTLFQVSDTFNFATFREYPCNYSARLLLLPEKNAIFTIEDNYIMKRMDVTDADDLVDYADVSYGGNGTKTAETIFNLSSFSFFSNKNDISSNPDDTDCYVSCLKSTDDEIAYAKLSDCLIGGTTVNRVTKTEIQNDGYSVNSPLCMSGNKIIFWDSVAQIVRGKNVDDGTYSIEIDLSTETITSAGFSKQINLKDGCLMFHCNKGTYVINKYKNENTFKQLTKINPNIEQVEKVLQYFPSSNVMISDCPDSTGLTLASNASKKYFVSYDDGLTWNQFFYDPYRTSWVLNDETVPLKGGRVSSDFIIKTGSPSFDPINTGDGHLYFLEFQEEGYSDLFTVKSLYLNDDVKGYLRRKP